MNTKPSTPALSELEQNYIQAELARYTDAVVAFLTSGGATLLPGANQNFEDRLVRYGGPTALRVVDQLRAARRIQQTRKEENEAFLVAAERIRAQQLLDKLELGRMGRLDLTGLLTAPANTLVLATHATIRAYPTTTLSGGFYYLTGKPTGFEQVWEEMLTLHGGVLARVSRAVDGNKPGIHAERSVTRYELALQLGPDRFCDLVLDPVGFGLRLAVGSESDFELSRSIALSFSERIWDLTPAPLGGSGSAAAMLADLEAFKGEDIEAGKRLVSALLHHRAECVANGVELFDADHLTVLGQMPPFVRISLVREGGPQQALMVASTKAAMAFPAVPA